MQQSVSDWNRCLGTRSTRTLLSHDNNDDNNITHPRSETGENDASHCGCMSVIDECLPERAVKRRWQLEQDRIRRTMVGDDSKKATRQKSGAEFDADRETARHLRDE